MNIFVVILIIAVIAISVLGAQNETQLRIVGGGTADNGQFPYIVSLKYQNIHICGGSILNSSTILTAAHCVIFKQENRFTVMAGSNKINLNIKHHKVKEIIRHLGFNILLLTNDIALLILDSALEFNSKISPIALETKFVGGNVNCVLSGWGSLESDDTNPNDLLYIKLKTISYEECLKQKHIISPPITTNHVCTLTKTGEGSCRGDSGGPLVANDKLIGIVSWGIPCAIGYPDVYTRVSSYIKWIHDHLNN